MSERIFLAGLLLLIIALIAFVVVAASAEEQQWQQFVIEHDCRVISTDPGQTGTGVSTYQTGFPGVVITYPRSRTAWQCDDGVTYWR